MNRITLDPVEPFIDGHLLDALIDLYLCSCTVEVGTLSGYRNSLAYVCSWWKMYAPANKWLLTPSALSICSKNLQDIGLSLNTRKAIHGRLRQCFRWAYRTGRIPLDIANWVPTPTGNTPTRAIDATLDTFKRMFDAANSVLFPQRAKALLAVFVGTGMRCSEAATIKVGDVHIGDDLSGTIFIHAKRVRGRSIGQRVVAFDSATGKILSDWLLVNDSEWLFKSETRNNHLTRRSIYRIVKEVARIAGVNDRIHGPHDIRRSYITYISRVYKGQGYDDLLRRQVGHSSYAMTKEYSYLNADDIKEAFQSPISHLQIPCMSPAE